MSPRMVLFVALLAGCGSRPAQPAPPAPVPAPVPTGDVVTAPTLPTPPVAQRRAHTVQSPHGNREDWYAWLRDDTRKDPEVLAYLHAENAYTDAMLAQTAPVQDTLYKEIVGRIKQDDTGVPTFDNGYWYYARFEEGKSYPIYARRKGTMDAPEQVMLDANELASGHDYYQIGRYEVSPDDSLMAYVEDTVGRNQFVLRIVDLKTGKLLPDTASNVTPSLEWAADSRTLFYVGKHPVTLLSDRVFRHVVGATEPPTLVYQETDTSYYTGLFKTKSDKYIVVALGSTETTESRLIDAAKPTRAPKVFLAREQGHQYQIEHVGREFLIYTNWDAKNYRLMSVSERKYAARKNWRERVPHRTDELLQDYAVYSEFFATSFRSEGLRKVRVYPRKGKPFVIDADDPAYVMYLQDTPDPAAKTVRYVYSSLTTPTTVFEQAVAGGERTLLKREPVLGDFAPANYATEYVHATAADGTKIPVSVVYRTSTPRDGTAPLLQYGYGSYGATMEPMFSSTKLSLLDRGFVYAIAHVRGGQEMGRHWYERGRQLTKMNSFTDFIAVTNFLVEQQYAAPDKVFAAGGSAGGLLMGAVVNLAPERYRGIVANVPFVDVVTTMLDESVPLTSNEFDEWGDPKVKQFYDYMLSYSPYDNVAATGYPSMLVTTGLWDSQVQYFEPAKWVAKLRATKTDSNLLLLHTNMDAGHGGKSGRYERYREIAREYAFLLHVLERPDSRH